MKFKKGDHLISSRTGYTHHGIYAGDNKVIHYSGFSDGFKRGDIEIVSLDEFANGKNIEVKTYFFRTYSHEVSVNRAYSRLGENLYSLFLNNCEHFVSWCIMGLHNSSQVNSVLKEIYKVTKSIRSSKQFYRTSKFIGKTVFKTGYQQLLFNTLTGQNNIKKYNTLCKVGIGYSVGMQVAKKSLIINPVSRSITTSTNVIFGAKKIIDWVLY